VVHLKEGTKAVQRFMEKKNYQLLTVVGGGTAGDYVFTYKGTGTETET
jgi:hypothetical protein